MRVVISGAGIGGLATALSLHAAGIDALVVEAAAELRPLGVGINLMPHAVRELTELRLGDALAATGIRTAEWAHFDRVEDVLSAAELAAFSDAYRATTLQDVAALNARPSLAP